MKKYNCFVKAWVLSIFLMGIVLNNVIAAEVDKGENQEIYVVNSNNVSSNLSEKPARINNDLRSPDGWFSEDMSRYLYQEGATGFEKELYAGYAESPIFSYDDIKTEFEISLVDAINNHQEEVIEIDVSQYKYTKDEVIKRIAILINEKPEFYYISPVFEYSENISYVDRIRLSIKDIVNCEKGKEEENVDGVAEYDPHQNDKEFVNAVTNILKQIDDSWSDEEKALFVHDYLCIHADYDYTYSNYSAYGVLVLHSGVCNSYSLAYDYIMDKLDIPCGKVSSSEMNHAWNMVEINGKSYYVDVTWDDSGGSSCYHSNFLRSKAGMIATGHDSEDWMNYSYPVYEHEITSTDRDEYFWSTCRSKIPNMGRMWLYTKKYPDCNVYAFDYDRGESIILAEFPTVFWNVWNPGNWNQYYPTNFMSLVSLGKYFAVSFPYKVVLLNESGSIIDTYELNAEEKNTGFVYGLDQENGVVEYTIATSPYAVEKTGSGKIDWSNYYNAPDLNYHYAYTYAGKNGSITPEGYTRIYDGSTLTISAEPKDGYKVRAYYVNGQEIDTDEQTYTLQSINNDIIFSVEFEERSVDNSLDKDNENDDIKDNSSSSSRVMTDVGEYSILTKMTADISGYFSSSLGVSKYISSDRKYASVSKKGILKAKKPGNTTVLGQKWTGRRYITVAEMYIEVQKPKLKKMHARSSNSYIDGMDYLSGTTWTPVSWKSSNSSIATADSYGRIRIHNPGTCTITAYFGSGKQVKVKAKLIVE